MSRLACMLLHHRAGLLVLTYPRKFGVSKVIDLRFVAWAAKPDTTRIAFTATGCLPPWARSTHTRRQVAII